jgi:hypothetical protein
MRFIAARQSDYIHVEIQAMLISAGEIRDDLISIN